MGRGCGVKGRVSVNDVLLEIRSLIMAVFAKYDGVDGESQDE